MSMEHNLDGRIERRLPIIVAVRLEPLLLVDTSHDQGEKTYTDNISLHGARVFSRSHWQPGEIVQLAPLNYRSLYGKVVYCQRLREDRHAVGVNFEETAVNWSIVQRYGLT